MAQHGGYPSILDLKNLAAIPTGHEVFDRKDLGFILGEISMSPDSTRKQGKKSSWLNCIHTERNPEGFKVAMFSGELMKEKVKTWLNQEVAAGRVCKKVCTIFYYVPKGADRKD